MHTLRLIWWFQGILDSRDGASNLEHMWCFGPHAHPYLGGLASLRPVEPRPALALSPSLPPITSCCAPVAAGFRSTPLATRSLKHGSSHSQGCQHVNECRCTTFMPSTRIPVVVESNASIRDDSLIISSSQRARTIVKQPHCPAHVFGDQEESCRHWHARRALPGHRVPRQRPPRVSSSLFPRAIEACSLATHTPFGS